MNNLIITLYKVIRIEDGAVLILNDNWGDFYYPRISKAETKIDLTVYFSSNSNWYKASVRTIPSGSDLSSSKA